MTQLRELYYCEKCGNVVEIVNEGAPALVCCGIPMVKLEAQTEDASTEKHVPYLEEKDGGVLVKVGQNIAHPMLENHYIKFIEVQTGCRIFRKELKPDDAPEAFFPIKKEDVIEVREWCNLHGLWKS
ncbi:MAG: desulfoferrodoxin [Candidatus Cloacimonetes bacterium]|jgi:superoxide reductase|nr:desulfoferrodoxin [Candidatus Cloacimonadota bacterium]MBT4575248.1 desulfoferrodoxin [Candidatus Cloacimonadota bacterium]